MTTWTVKVENVVKPPRKRTPRTSRTSLDNASPSVTSSQRCARPSGDAVPRSRPRTTPSAAVAELRASLLCGWGQLPKRGAVKWGMDRDADGRIDGRDDDSIKVDWSATGTSGSGGSYGGWW